MSTGYVKLDDNDGLPRALPRAPADLACWTALVHAWDDIEQALGEVINAPALAGEPDGAPGLTDVRPFA